MQARSALSIQRDVVFAIFVREMNARFSTYTFGNIWILLEPLVMMGMFVFLFGLRGSGNFGYAEPPIFIMAAYLPFKLLWQGTMRKNMSVLGGARGLMGFRQVRMFDLSLARTLVEGGLFVVVASLLIVIMEWLGFNAVPGDPLKLFYYCVIFWLFAASFGLLMCVVSSFAREIEKVVSLMTLPLLFISAVLYPMSILPTGLQKALSVNPLVHANELIREAWFPLYNSPVADTGYLISWTGITMALALASYRLRWQRMIAR